MIKEKDNDIYELWWEYLKRSEKYKKFCHWWELGGDKPIPKSLKRYHHPLWTTYVQFGNVHRKSFKEWWSAHLNNPFPCPYHPYYPEIGKSMIDYRSVIGKDIYKIFRKFKKEQGREPNIEELIQNLKLYMAYWEKQRLYLLIELQHSKLADIGKEFRDLLREKKKEHNIKQESKHIKGMKGIITIRKNTSTVSDLQRYLKVYDDHKAGGKYSEIAKYIRNDFPKESKLGDEEFHYYEKDVERAIKRDFQKANKIIKNVENGHFPGEF